MRKALLHSLAQMYVLGSVVLQQRYPKEQWAFLRNQSIDMENEYNKMCNISSLALKIACIWVSCAQG